MRGRVKIKLLRCLFRFAPNLPPVDFHNFLTMDNPSPVPFCPDEEGVRKN